MELNENKNFENHGTFEKEPLILKEEKDHKNLWYLLLALLVLILLGWYGYTAGWFSKNVQKNIVPAQKNSVEQQKTQLPFASSQDVKAPIDNVVIQTSNTFPVQKLLVVRGNLPDGCTYLNDEQVVRDGNTFYVNLTTRREGDMCTQTLVPYERKIALNVDGLPAGEYIVVINGKQTDFSLEQNNFVDTSIDGK